MFTSVGQDTEAMFSATSPWRNRSDHVTPKKPLPIIGLYTFASKDGVPVADVNPFGSTYVYVKQSQSATGLELVHFFKLPLWFSDCLTCFGLGR